MITFNPVSIIEPELKADLKDEEPPVEENGGVDNAKQKPETD